jgi:hypothetical protein
VLIVDDPSQRLINQHLVVLERLPPREAHVQQSGARVETWTCSSRALIARAATKALEMVIDITHQPLFSRTVVFV